MSTNSPSPTDLLVDLFRIGPAPTPPREAAVWVVFIVALIVLFTVIDVSVPLVVVAALATAYMVVRGVVGLSRWKREAQS